MVMIKILVPFQKHGMKYGESIWSWRSAWKISYHCFDRHKKWFSTIHTYVYQGNWSGKFTFLHMTASQLGISHLHRFWECWIHFNWKRRHEKSRFLGGMQNFPTTEGPCTEEDRKSDSIEHTSATMGICWGRFCCHPSENKERFWRDDHMGWRSQSAYTMFCVIHLWYSNRDSKRLFCKSFLFAESAAQYSAWPWPPIHF